MGGPFRLLRAYTVSAAIATTIKTRTERVAIAQPSKPIAGIKELPTIKRKLRKKLLTLAKNNVMNAGQTLLMAWR
jgi:hypothetical protein